MQANKTQNDMTYHITMNHMNNLFNMSLITRHEYNLINKEMIEKYKPLFEDDIDLIDTNL